MSLTTALGIAQSALQSTAKRTSVVSQNIANEGNSDYARRTAILSSDAPGVRVAEVRRAANEALLKQNLSALSSTEAQTFLMNGLDTLSLYVNGVDNQNSAAIKLGEFEQALQLYSASPSSLNLAESTIEAARQLANSLNGASHEIQSYRGSLDLQISNSVTELNDLLKSFDVANKAVVAAYGLGRDPNDALDQRDALLKKISALVPVSSFTRSNEDMVLTTSNGVMLYEKSPRTISFEPKASYAAGELGNALYVDGIAIDIGAGGNTSSTGRIAAMMQLRDDVSVTMQAQLDEVARALIDAFAETGPGGALAKQAGLFTWAGGPAMPGAGLTNGLALSIRLNPAMDSSVGGSASLLRDGGVNGAGYVVNTTGAASFPSLLNSYSERLEQPFGFDPVANAGGTATLADFATGTISWFEALRQQSGNAVESKSALLLRTQEALSNEAGVNLDNEMALMLELENAYQASARLIRTVDEMMATLLAMVE